MAATDILVKTAKGEAEIKASTPSLSMKQRSLLVMIDGKLTEGDYLQRLKAIGNVETLIRDLETGGYVERKAGVIKVPRSTVPELNREARKYMAEFMYSLLGPEGESTALKIERCKNNSELADMVDVCCETLTALGKPEKASEFSQSVKNMIQ